MSALPMRSDDVGAEDVIDSMCETVAQAGHSSDPITANLNILSSQFERLQKIRIMFSNQAFALSNQGLVPHAKSTEKDVEQLLKMEKSVERRLGKELKEHITYPWLSQFPGLAGPRTGAVLATISDPLLFPGQKCTVGHHHPPFHSVGSPCSGKDENGESCPGTLLPPRTTTGVRSLWHYFGLHCDENGKSPRRRRRTEHTIGGADYNVKAKTLVLGKLGLADQIVRHRVPKYRDIYDATKERLARERGEGVVAQSVNELQNGSRPLKPFQIDAIAKKVAVKAFLGDLLVEWKHRVSGESIGDV